MSANESKNIKVEVLDPRASIKPTKVVSIDKLMEFEPKALLTGLRKNLDVVFNDGIKLALTSREITINRYIFEITKVAPGLKLRSVYSIHNYYTNHMYVAKSINKCFEVILQDIVEQFVKPVNDRSILVAVYAKIYEIFNVIYNEVVYTKLEYAASLNILDFLQIQMDPDLLKALKEVHNNKDLESINKSYEVLDYIIRNKPEYRSNIIGMGYISGTVNPNQIKQMLAARGFVTEIDSSIFKYPIASSFTLGMNDIYDLSIESRSGAKALFLSNKAIQESEYFAREMQLVVMSVEKLVDEDCGNTDYIDWLVRDESLTSKPDLPNLVGKRFLNDAGIEEVITKNHHHLVGKTIKLRSVMKCKIAHKNKVCTSCFGDLSYGCHDHTNIGHISSTTVTQKLSQSILSTKHLTSSATSSAVVLDETSKKFFSVKNKDGYGFRSSVLGKARSKIVMVIDQQSAFGLKDLKPGNDVHKLNPSRVSRIESFVLEVHQQDGKVDAFPIIVKSGNRFGSFTYEFLDYIVNNGFHLDDNDRYIIDLKEWTSTVAILRLPQVEFNFLALAKAIKAEFKYMKTNKDNTSIETQESILQKIFDLVNSKLDVNIAMLEVIVYAFTVMNAEENNYDLGRNSKNPQLARIYDIISNRSLGAGYAWERVLDYMLSPASFDGRNSVDHLLDVLVRPTETLIDYGEL